MAQLEQLSAEVAGKLHDAYCAHLTGQGVKELSPAQNDIINALYFYSRMPIDKARVEDYERSQMSNDLIEQAASIVTQSEGYIAESLEEANKWLASDEAEAMLRKIATGNFPIEGSSTEQSSNKQG